MCILLHLLLFTQYFVPTLTYLASCTGKFSTMAQAEKQKNKLIRKTGSVLETALVLLELIMQRKKLLKLINIMDNARTPSTQYTDAKPLTEHKCSDNAALATHWREGNYSKIICHSCQKSCTHCAT